MTAYDDALDDDGNANFWDDHCPHGRGFDEDCEECAEDGADEEEQGGEDR
jgi:hypothetical protein